MPQTISEKSTFAATNHKLCELALAVIETEANAVAALKSRINQSFIDACHYLLNCPGRIVVLGMGKSGHIAKKVAATMASTGTPAFYVHPGEAGHGDSGMITDQDVIVALSNSGKTEEILTLLPLIKRLNIPLIALTGDPNSLLAETATTHIDVSVDKEACPLGLAPTASTTAMLAMGDALSIALLDARGFTQEDFARSHPGGSLGRRLLLHVNDIMHTEMEIPKVTTGTLLSDVLIEMTQKGLGLTSVVDENNKLCGIFTDGDLRRTLDANIDIHTIKINEIMTSQCKTISPDLLAVEALQQMEAFKITALLVVDDHQHVVGVIHMHDLLQAKVV